MPFSTMLLGFPVYLQPSSSLILIFKVQIFSFRHPQMAGLLYNRMFLFIQNEWAILMIPTSTCIPCKSLCILFSHAFPCNKKSLFFPETLCIPDLISHGVLSWRNFSNSIFYHHFTTSTQFLHARLCHTQSFCMRLMHSIVWGPDHLCNRWNTSGALLEQPGQHFLSGMFHLWNREFSEMFHL